jgi:hypothetical protein
MYDKIIQLSLKEFTSRKAEINISWIVFTILYSDRFE